LQLRRQRRRVTCHQHNWPYRGSAPLLAAPDRIWFAALEALPVACDNVKMKRCDWARIDLSIGYHDREWGVPCRDERTLFEFLILEGAQAGLSWDTILKKRAAYRLAFDNFDAEKVARYGKRDVARLLGDAGIVRNRLKVESAISNAKETLSLRESAGGLRTFLWQFVEDTPIQNRWLESRQVPPRSAASDAMSKLLKQRGFRFVGSTICYALMQAVGMVNDHLVTCPRHDECRVLGLGSRPGRRIRIKS
jgi:DNA-3-methyladenine glycosylase I